MTTEQMRWIVEWCNDTGSLLFMWEGSCGYQPILMPGFTYHWWLDDSATLYQDREGASRGGRPELLN